MKKTIKEKITIRAHKPEKCPLCSSKEIIYKYTHTTFAKEIYKVGEKFDIYKCKTCKTYFIEPIPSKDELDYLYKNYSEASHCKSGDVRKKENFEITYSNLDKWLISKKRITWLDRIYVALWGFDNRFLDLLEYAKARKFHKVLDVGSGSGYFLKQLVKFLGLERNNITGIDVFPEIEQIGKLIGIEMKNVKLEEYLEFDFDLITLNHVLEHVPNPKSIIEEIYRRLAPGGIFFLSVPNGRGLPSRIFGIKWICYSAPQHIYTFSKESIIKITQGFELEHYSSGTYAVCIWKHYSKSKFWQKILTIRLIGINRLISAFLTYLSLGDSQNFIFKKKNDRP